jgi:hypothetical protein
MQRKHRLQREIGLVLACKALALGILYVAFFMPGHGVRVTPESLSTHLLAPAGESGGH